MNSSRWILALVAVLLGGVACSNDATGGDTRAGTLALRLTTPHADDGASSPAAPISPRSPISTCAFLRPAASSTPNCATWLS